MIEFFLNHLTYPYIFLAMLLESTVFPIPSELIVAPAAYHAAAGYQDVIVIVLLATIGADFGASINYIVARIYGRPLIYRFANSRLGRLCMLNQQKVEKSEAYFEKHGAAATLTGRLVPVIRHLISLPAGLARMNYWKFLLFTTVGAGAWHTILAAMGWYMHAFVSEEELYDTIEHYNHYILSGIVSIVILAAIYLYMKHKREPKEQ